jgi:acyl-CoA reductase-like NAD-dependent aldehyde dehydrogenase
MASPKFPEPPLQVAATPLGDCDQAVAELRQGAPQWAAYSTKQRAAILRRCMTTLRAESAAWVASSCSAKGHGTGSTGEGEEWVNGIMTVMRDLRLYAQALDHGGQPPLPAVRKLDSGQNIVRVFPANVQDKVLLTGFSAEVWIEPGEQPSQGALYRQKTTGQGGQGAVSLVLGAGNQASIGPMDVLHKLVLEDEVCLLKMNPVNDYLGAHVLRALKPLVDANFLRVVYGGAEVGQHLCHHEGIDSIHITGSERTHDAIVWGGDNDEVARRKSAGERQNHKPISSELGAVSPIMVVPGVWSAAELQFQARQITSMVVQNASFNCNAGKVLILADGWAQKADFLNALRKCLSAEPPRRAYYPGAQQRYQCFLDEYPEAEVLGERGDEVVPWTLIQGLGATPAEYALKTEAFCGILAVVELAAADASEYVSAVVPFCNDTMWGTLSCNLIVHPKTEAALGGAIDKAIGELRYGAIGVNCWSGMVYGLCNTTWGAFPGHPLEDIQSGRGTVHNTFLLDHPQKSVVRAPWIIKPTPAWFVDHKNLPALGKRLVDYELKTSWLKIPGVAAAAFKG